MENDLPVDNASNKNILESEHIQRSNFCSNTFQNFDGTFSNPTNEPKFSPNAKSVSASKNKADRFIFSNADSNSIDDTPPGYKKKPKRSDFLPKKGKIHYNFISKSEPDLHKYQKEFESIDSINNGGCSLLPPLVHLKKHIKVRSITSADKPTKSIAMPSIDIKTARSRSYLYGRVGGIKGSLLGQNELIRFFPQQKVNVFVGTWNMNGQIPIQEINDFLLPESLRIVPDIYAIGIQEACPDKREWDIVVQTTIGPLHVLLHSVSLGALHLSIFIRRDLIWYCSEPEDETIITRPSSVLHTKGAVAICFYFFGTFFLFINSHLSAHEDRINARIEDYEKIVSRLTLPRNLPLKKKYQNKELCQRFDHIFWFGDLNFRVAHNKDKVIKYVNSVPEDDPSASPYNYLLNFDELKNIMSSEKAFVGFSEAAITFGPSYKYSLGSNKFDELAARVPSYTDRILYRSMQKDSLLCNQYNRVSTLTTSDHKPVYASFKALIKPGTDNLPLSAGLFDRTIYHQALKKRGEALKDHIPLSRNTSSVCSLM